MDSAFLRRVRKTPDGCWVWTGATIRGTRGGRYAYLTRDGENWLGHRWAYTQARGEIPDGLVLDHICRNTLCVNPDHLEAVTNQVNSRRGRIGDKQRSKFESRTHCRHGHPMTSENTRLQRTRPKGRTNPDGSPYEFWARRCRLCEKIQNKRYREKRSSAGDHHG